MVSLKVDDAMGITELRKLSNEIVLDYNSGESTWTLGKKYKTYSSNISKVLKENNTRLRSSIKHIKLQPTLLENINGWMLGDGSIRFTGIQAYFSFSSKHEEYVDFVINKYSDNNISCKKYFTVDKNSKTEAWKMRTFSTMELAQLYHRWYSNGAKIIPRDIQLSNISLRNWIMDDGTLSKEKGHMRLCTCCFTIDECEFLSEKLNEFVGVNDIHVIEKKKHPRIYISKTSTEILLEKIGSCEVQCFNYKWDIYKGN